MWVPITLAAATFQILRTSRQHQLRSILSVNAAGYVRYAYGFPLALIAAVATYGISRRGLPDIPLRFWPIIAGAGIAQIGGTLALLKAFDLRDFAIGTVYAKTEIVLVAIVSAVALGEPLAPSGLGRCGRLHDWRRLARSSRRITNRLVECGRSSSAHGRSRCPAGFAVAAVGIRAASNSLGDAPIWHRAVLTLTVMLGIQTVINGTQLAATNRSELVAVYSNWRAALPVGILSVAGSAGWATAVTLTNATKVRTLGQVELLMAFAISVFWLHEHHERSEYAASALVMAGVIGVVAFG